MFDVLCKLFGTMLRSAEDNCAAVDDALFEQRDQKGRLRLLVNFPRRLRNTLI